MKPTDEFRQELIDLIPRIRRFCRVLTGNLADADDVVQACLEKAMINHDQWQAGTQLDRWVFRIARNTWLDDRRRAHNRMPHDDIADLHDLPDTDGEILVQQRGVSRMVRSAIDALPDDQRVLVGLIMLEGYTYREASEQLDLPIGTVMSRLSRAKASLAKALEDERDPS